MKIKYIILLLAVLLSYPTNVHSQEIKLETLDSLINEALYNNPQIKAAFNNWKAEEYKIKQASGLPDPMASYTYFGESVETKVGPEKHKYGVSQKVPFPGKLSLKGKAQAKSAAMFMEKYEATKREVIKNIKFVYYDMFWVDTAIQISEEEKNILENMEKVAQRKYESNSTPIQDVIKAQIELSKIIDKLLFLEQNKRSLEAKMNALLSRPKATKFNRIKNVGLIEFNYSIGDLHELASSNRQELIAANMNIERAKYQRSLAGLDFLPDFTFGFDYIQIGKGTTNLSNDGQDAWTTTFAVHVPIWIDKQFAELREKQASLRASEENYDDVKNSVIYEVEDMFYKIKTYNDIVNLYKTALVPQTEQAFDAAKTSYETGRVDFLTWLDAERVLLQTRLAYYKAIADYQKSVAYLERIIGIDL